MSREKSALVLALLAVGGAGTWYFSTRDDPEWKQDFVIPLGSQVARVTPPIDGDKPNDALTLERLPPSPAPQRRVSLSFSDGISAEVVVRAFRPASIAVSASRLADVYEDLRNQSLDGDAVAARTLYENLQTCGYAYPDEESLNAALSKLRTDRVLQFPEGARARERHLRLGIDAAQFERELIEPYLFCEGISQEQRDEGRLFAMLAAENGDYLGMRYWGAELGGTARAEWWMKAWNAGYVGVLEPLGLYYEGRIPGSPIDQPDWVKAYAYQLASAKLYESIAPNAGSPAAISAAAARAAALRTTLANLTPQQTAEAEQLAADLLVTNRNCCLTSFGPVAPWPRESHRGVRESCRPH